MIDQWTDLDDGWHALPDGRIGLASDGVWLATIEHHPGRENPYSTEAQPPALVRILRSFGTLDAAKAHCEAIARQHA